MSGPAQKEDIFNFPFHTLAFIFVQTLNSVDELVVIGHKFGDPEITSAITAALERENFKLTIVNPNAKVIAESLFKNRLNVNAVESTIEDWMNDGFSNYRKKVNRYVNTTKVEEQTREEVIKQTIIANYKRSSEFQIEKENIIKEYEKQKISNIPVVTSPHIADSLILNPTGIDVKVLGEYFPAKSSKVFDLVKSNDPNMFDLVAKSSNPINSTVRTCSKYGGSWSLLEKRCTSCGSQS